MPDILRRMPQVMYAAAALIFVWNLANQYFAIVSIGTYPAPGMEQWLPYQKSVALYGAFLEAVYIVASGAMIHVLLAIYDKLAEAAE